MSAETFDYVIIGGGSAGCIVAARLASESDARVLLLELGERGEDNPETLIVDGYKQAFVNDRVMWPKYTTPQPGCLDKSMFVGSGRGLGGSGAINAMVYLRSSVADFDDWGVPSWRWSELLGDYEQLERVLDPRRREPTEFSEACIHAAEQVGFRRAQELDDGDLRGAIGYERMNYRGEQRRSSYVAFLQPALARPNLRVVTSARVERVVFEASFGPRPRPEPGPSRGEASFGPRPRPEPGPSRGEASRRVLAVEYTHAGVRRRVQVEREAVLCAGAVESAKLLMLSGIGPAAQLRRHGIEVLLDQPAVGRNFQDHPNVTLFYRGRREVDAKYPQLYGFHRAKPDSAHLRPGQPDTCYVFYPAKSSLREMLLRILPTLMLPASLRDSAMTDGIRTAVSLAFDRAAVRRFVARLYGLVVILGKPRSRGSVELGGDRAEHDARIDPAYFSHRDDLDTMVEGLRLARRIAGAPALQDWGARELFPGGMVTSPRLLEGFVRANAMTTYHFAGTCSMGVGPHSVVDEQLAVRGVEGLRIADASIMPVVPVSALNAPSMLIGYRAATLLLSSLSGHAAGSGSS